MKKFVIKDKPNAITIEVMRSYFGSMMESAERFRAESLEVVKRGGQFYYYKDGEVDTFWNGFAFGMRMAKRIENASFGVTSQKGNQ